MPNPTSGEAGITLSNAENMSDGALPVSELASVNLGLEEQAHRFSTERTLFNSALCFAALLYCAAMVFGALLFYALQRNPEIHWHVSLLIGAFIVPPTVICVTLIRGVYGKAKASDADSSKDDGFPIPAADMLKDLLKDFAKELGKVIKP